MAIRTPRRGALVVTTIDVSLDVHMRGALRDLQASGSAPITIAAADTGRLRTVAEREGVVAHELPLRRNPSPFNDLRALLALIVLYARVRPALTVYGTPKAALLCAIASVVTGVPARVQILHGLRLETVHGPGRRVLLAMERIVLLLSTSTIAVSRSLRDRVSALGLPADRVRVLGPGGFVGIDVTKHGAIAAAADVRERRRIEMGVALGTPLIGFAGRVTRDKGIVELLDAVDAMRTEGSAVELALVGPDEGTEELPERTQQLLGAPWVHVTGGVPDAAEYIAAFDLLALPSHREGLPTVVLEAMASRVPVVASAATGVVDLVEDGVTGLLVPVGDAAALATAMSTVLGDADVHRGLVARGEAFVSRSFSCEQVWRRHRSHYAAVRRVVGVGAR